MGCLCPLAFQFSSSVVRLIGWLLVYGSLLAHVLIDKVKGFVSDRLRACHRIASSLAVAHLFGGYVVAQLDEGGMKILKVQVRFELHASTHPLN